MGGVSQRLNFRPSSAPRVWSRRRAAICLDEACLASTPRCEPHIISLWSRMIHLGLIRVPHALLLSVPVPSGRYLT